MYFITCLDENYLQNARWFSGEHAAPRDAEGAVEYRASNVRTFGYFEDLARALLAVERNEQDLHECAYTWCVVERVGPGIHAGALTDESWWFQWDFEGRRWTPATRPTALSYLAGALALG